MWFTAAGACDWSEASGHLGRVDAALGAVIERVGRCTLHRRRDYFVALCQAIFTQQVATPVAVILFDRFRDLFPGRRPTPRGVLRASEEELRGVGLSRQKLSYLRDLAERFATNALPTRRWARMSDEQVIESLVQVRGIGRWTAEMFLIFVLNRPDVLPADDLGLRKGVQTLYGLQDTPSAADVLLRGERWRPYRTVATWYIWRGS
jgi:3-methyladenine DNA glycosylase/8-oxoguanine DNA glycosylase